jgi:hypothetical protein
VDKKKGRDTPMDTPASELLRVFYWRLCASHSSGQLTRISRSENPRGVHPTSSTALSPTLRASRWTR